MKDSTRKVLSVKQPWATLLLEGVKSIESRTWATRYRGPLLIHASEVIDRLAFERKGFDPSDQIRFPRGAVIAAVILKDVRPLKAEDSHAAGFEILDAFGRYAWVVEGARAVYPPLHTKGRLGLWKLKPEDAAQLVEASR